MGVFINMDRGREVWKEILTVVDNRQSFGGKEILEDKNTHLSVGILIIWRYTSLNFHLP